MMKKKIEIIVIAITVILSCLYLLYFFDIAFSEKAKKSKINIERSKIINKEMSIKEILSIMGKPDVSFFDSIHDLEVYQYYVPFGSSEGIYIHIDTLNEKVVKIDYWE